MIGSWLELPKQHAATVRREGPDEIILDLAPEAALLVRLERGGPLEFLDALAGLQARLGPPPDPKQKADVSVGFEDQVERWESDYEVQGDRFHVSMRRVHGDGVACTVLALERGGTAPERSVLGAVKLFRSHAKP